MHKNVIEHIVPKRSTVHNWCSEVPPYTQCVRVLDTLIVILNQHRNYECVLYLLPYQLRTDVLLYFWVRYKNAIVCAA